MPAIRLLEKLLDINVHTPMTHNSKLPNKLAVCGEIYSTTVLPAVTATYVTIIDITAITAFDKIGILTCLTP
ncbi:hypothetical protein D3C79_1026970 [compost metagenome]